MLIPPQLTMNHREFSMHNGFSIEHVNENTTNYLKVPKWVLTMFLSGRYCLTRFFNSHGRRQQATDNAYLRRGRSAAGSARPRCRQRKRLVEFLLCALAGKNAWKSSN